MSHQGIRAPVRAARVREKNEDRKGTHLVHIVLEDLASFGGQVVDVEPASWDGDPVGFLVLVLPPNDGALWDGGGDEQGLAAAAFEGCLLYTSDAADE